MYPLIKKLRAHKLEWYKNFVQIVAILAAGLFAFFTWGLDYLIVNQPNWDTSISYSEFSLGVNKDSIKLIFAKENNRYESYIGDTANSFLYQATLEVKNNGKRPIYIRETEIKVYFLEREKSAGIVNTSLYSYYESIIKNNQDSALCIVLNEIDNLPIFPGNSGTRSFSFEVIPSKLYGIEMPLRKFAHNYVMLLIATQTIDSKRFFCYSTKHSTAARLINNIGYLRSVEFQSPLKNDSTTTSK